MVSMSILTLAMAVLTPFVSVNAVVPLPRDFPSDNPSNIASGVTEKLPTISFLDPDTFYIFNDSALQPDVRDAVDRLNTTFKTFTHQYLSPKHGAEFSFAPNNGNTLKEIRLTVLQNTSLSIAEEAVKPVDKRDESYSLKIPTAGAVILQANTSLGLLRGLTTFEQLFYKCPEQVREVVCGIMFQES
jgi:hypothetical protein